jgi:hypothetical protein
MGYGPQSAVTLTGVRIEPAKVRIGGKVRIEVDLANPEPDPHGAIVDLIVHFVKANGSTSEKVFKGTEVNLKGGGNRTFSKTVSLRQHSTRTHYPGKHTVEIQVNGTVCPGGSFELSD